MDKIKVSFPRELERSSLKVNTSQSGVTARAFQQLRALGARFRGDDNLFYRREDPVRM